MLWIVIGVTALVVLAILEVRSWKKPEKLDRQYGDVLSAHIDDTGRAFDSGAGLRKPRD